MTGTQRTARRRPRNRWLLLGGFSLVLAALLVWAFRSPDYEMPNLHATLADAADSAGTNGAFELSALVPVDWDRAYVFPPYNGIDSIRKQLGFAWSPLSPAMTLVWGDLFLANEGLNLVVFVRGADTVSGWSILGTEYGEQPYLEFGDDGRPVVIEREHDLLEVSLPPFGPSEAAYRLVVRTDNGRGHNSYLRPADTLARLCNCRR